MSEPFLAEVRLFGFNFPPRNWAFCDGQILPINQNQSLYSLLGTTYGGDGRTSFGLPDLRGRAPVHSGGSAGSGLTSRPLGNKSGWETETLTAAQIPSHTHTSTARKASTDTATATTPTGNLPATVSPGFNVYGDAASSPTPGGVVQVESVGGGQSHNNMQPYLVVTFCIALQGLFPSRN